MRMTENKILIILLHMLVCLYIKINGMASSRKHPNVVILLADDLGIGDLGCFGNSTIKTPNIDRLAAEGVILSHHLSAAGLCTPSRAALLTARYPARYGLAGDPDTPPVVVHIASKSGLPQSETTIAEAFAASGYTTAIVGKWHLGSGCGWFGAHCHGPLLHGFQHFFGLLFTLTSNMEGYPSFWIFYLDDPFYTTLLCTFLVAVGSCFYLALKKSYKWSLRLLVGSALFLIPIWFVYAHYRMYTKHWWRVSPWMEKYLNGVVMRNTEVVHQFVHYESIFDEMINESVSFIRSNARTKKPFLLFHSFLHVHTPMYVSKSRSGRSAHGRYGDNVEEMDAGVGFILDVLKEEDLERDTIVYFASDHGGHLEAIDPANGQRTGGFNKRFKGGKGMGAPEGAIRVPGIIRWTGVIPAGSSLATPTSLLDMLPTLLQMAGLPTLKELTNETKELDGVSFAPLLRQETRAKTPKRVLIHHCRSSIHGLRLITESKVYKMYLYLHRWQPNSTQCGWGENVLCGCFGDQVIDVSHSPVLYEVVSDPYEDNPIDSSSPEYQEIVKELDTFLQEWKKNVSYPQSQFGSFFNNILSPWLQPFKSPKIF